ncbi:F-box/FBD/LRR-repeat protein At1g13570-like [Vicia villosa]|uniref:F-box/FBD/LRR-repeat protein At1g13570-like n=1 Tax=Vicia villosa TaxID=3911 RepID=UPI00273BF1B3|nr:F-box/FBD/LRR-repeat protein At1g13570-like [Vicia villosa]
MMTLLNKKASRSDLINDLPSNVVDAILANLTLRDQVRTSILSKNWRYMWTSVSQICIDECFFERFWHVDDRDRDRVVCKIITKVLMLHNGPIHKFTLFIPFDSCFKITVEYLNMWIPILSKKDIKYLELVNCDDAVPDEMPYIVLSCKELTYFEFGGFNLSVPPNFCSFKRLLELHLVCVRFESGALESLMSGCPILEKLSIEQCTGCDSLVISSPSLKVFELELRDDMKSISLKRAKNLIDFTLNAQQNNLSGSIKGLPKLKSLSLFGMEKIPLADIIPPTLLTSSLSSLEYLKLSDMNLNEKGELLYFVSVLKSAPRLIELDIQNYNMVDTAQVSDLSEELKCRSCCCLKLQTVNIYMEANSQHVMSLIKFILANSTLLKTLTLDCSYNKLKADMLFRISQDLLLMERASPRAQVKFHPSSSTYSLFE